MNFNQKEKIRKELFLDTKGTCFLCLFELETGDETDKKWKEVCLRILCKYLSVSSSAVLRKGLEVNSRSTEPRTEGCRGEDQCDFSVNLCPTCTSVLEELNALIRQQEMVTMLLEHHVRVLNQILGKCENLDLEQRWRRNNAVSTEEILEVRLVKQLRLETRRKCNRKVLELRMKSFPKVALKRLGVSSVSANSVLHLKEPENQNPSHEDPPVESLTPVESTPERLPTSHYHANYLSMAELFKNDISQESKLSLNDYQKGYECQFCKKVVTGTKIRSHMVNLHPEKVFSSVKLPSIPQRKFRLWCRDLMISETKKASSALACLFCNELFCSGYYLREHLVLKHFKLLEERLIQLQENKGNSRNERVVSGGPINLKCDLCGHCFPSENALTFHKRRSCPRRPRQIWICTLAGGGCGKSFFSRKMFTKHQKLNAVKDAGWTCNDGHCEQTFLYECGLNKHKAESSHGRNVRRSQWICDFVGGGCGKIFCSMGNLKRKKYKVVVL